MRGVYSRKRRVGHGYYRSVRSVQHRASFIVPAQAAGQPLACAFPQVDDLLPRDRQQFGDAAILQRQVAPQRRELDGRHLQRRRNLPHRRHAGQRQGRDHPVPFRVPQVQQQRGALPHRQLQQFLPQPPQPFPVDQTGDDGRLRIGNPRLPVRVVFFVPPARPRPDGADGGASRMPSRAATTAQRSSRSIGPAACVRMSDDE